MTDLGGNTLALRPEFTAAIARAYIEHGMVTHPQPVKLFTVGALFRYDKKPQEGRYRQHHQFNCEIVGEGKPAVDAQLIFMAHKFFSYLGIPSVLHINSIGCLECRAVYRATLTESYRSKRSLVCEDCKRRLAKNPLRLLDCKVETCQPVKALAPHIVDSLCELCKKITSSGSSRNRLMSLKYPISTIRISCAGLIIGLAPCLNSSSRVRTPMS